MLLMQSPLGLASASGLRQHVWQSLRTTLYHMCESARNADMFMPCGLLGPDLPDIIFAQLHEHKVPHPVLRCWPPLTLESRVLRRIALIVCAVHEHALASIQIAGVLQLHHDLHIRNKKWPLGRLQKQ